MFVYFIQMYRPIYFPITNFRILFLSLLCVMMKHPEISKLFLSLIGKHYSFEMSRGPWDMTPKSDSDKLKSLTPLVLQINAKLCPYIKCDSIHSSNLICFIISLQNKIHSDQLKRTEAHINSQRDHLLELTSQHQDLLSQLQQSRQQFSALQYKVTPHLTSSAIWQSGGV